MGKLLVLCLAHLLTLAAAAAAATAGSGEDEPLHIHFFWHDKSKEPNSTAVIVAKGPDTDNSPTRFGTVRVMDDPITAEPDVTSELLGRSQGMYLSADQTHNGLLMVMTFEFTGALYNGSTLVIAGRNEVPLAVREMAIIGGTGAFRTATGYVQANGHSYTKLSGTFVVEYNCYVSFPVLHSSVSST